MVMSGEVLGEFLFLLTVLVVMFNWKKIRCWFSNIRTKKHKVNFTKYFDEFYDKEYSKRK